MTRRVLLMLALTILATVVPMATAQACSCMAPDAALFLAESDFVFSGSLVERPGAAGGQIDEFGFENVAYTFEVDAVYKGDLRDTTVSVWSASNGAACGFEMAVGERVAIAASFSGGQLTGGLCATFGVDQLESAAAEAGIQPIVPVTDAPVQPEATDQSVSGTAGLAPAVAAVAALAAVVAVALAAMLRKGRGA